MKNLCISFALTSTLLLAAPSSPAAARSSAASREQEARLIAVLQSDASQKDKADACRELAHVGSKASVPVLVSLLRDEKLSHMARYGLETNPDRAVDQALRDALSTLKGRQLAGVIASLGVRRDTRAVKPISGFLQDADLNISRAAAHALGDIGSKAAAQALEAVLPAATGERQLALCEGLFRCAEAFSKQRSRKDALRIYDRLHTLPSAAHQIRAGALRGAILIRGNGGVKLMIEALRGTDWILADAAARTAMEMPGSTVTKALTEVLAALSGDRILLVLQVIGHRADAAALPVVLDLARSSDLSTRLAAIRTTGEIDDAAAAQPLADLTRDANGEIARAARESLASLPGRKADEVVLRMLGSPDADTKLAALELVAMRRMVSAVPALDKATTDSNSQVRASALKQLAEFGGEQELPGMLSHLDRATDAEILGALEEALSTLCTRIGKPDTCATLLIARLEPAKPAQKAVLLAVLGHVGGAKALAAVSAAVSSSEPTVHAAALDALADWPSAEVAPELLKLARTLNTADDKLQCLRSYLRWAADSDVPAKQRLAMCKDAAGLIQRPQEKKMLLAALGAIYTAESVELVLPFLEDAATREEACVAIVNIGERMARSRNVTRLSPRVLEALESAAQATSSQDLAKRARTAAASSK